jgi:hypothetical protein
MNDAYQGLSQLRTSEEWITYFEKNALNQLPIPWERGAEITSEELAAIGKSLSGWQLGETSDGSHLLAAATNYANSIGDPQFIDAVKLFIKEEQAHGYKLGQFLDLAGFPRAKSHWSDTLFRTVRYAWPRMEIWATPVVMVETHAMIYYNAIRRATGSKVLQCICKQILRDEVPHIRFQCERLAILHRDRPAWLLFLTMMFHHCFFTAITLAIWASHRRALRAGGYSFMQFWRSAWTKMEVAWKRMAPSQYALPVKLKTSPQLEPSMI